MFKQTAVLSRVVQLVKSFVEIQELTLLVYLLLFIVNTLLKVLIFTFVLC